MNAELKETLELARAIDHVITFSEHHCATLPVRRAAERIREGVVQVVRQAFDDLKGAWPTSDPEEIARFEKALENGEIPKAEGLPGYMPHLLGEEMAKLERKLAPQKVA